MRLQGASPGAGAMAPYRAAVPAVGDYPKNTMNMAGIIPTAAGLGFLIPGVQPPEPEWGATIPACTYMMECWWVVTIPGAGDSDQQLSAFNFLEMAYDILDPRSE